MVDFRKADPGDAPFMGDLYNYYVQNSTATFHQKPLTREEIISTFHLEHSDREIYIVLLDEEPCGFCLLKAYNPKEAYRTTKEVTLYLSQDASRKGIGQKVLDFLHKRAHNLGVKVIVALVSYENEGSIRLFSKMGYEKAGHLKRVGYKFDRWLDVIFYQIFI